MVKKFALIFGIVYAGAGILGFIPGLVTPADSTGMAGMMDSSHGRLFGLFPVNLWHNVFHIVIGLWGIVAARDFGAAVSYARINTVLFAVLTVFGLIPAANTFFGIMPLYSHDVWLHGLTAAAMAYFGFVAPARVET